MATPLEAYHRPVNQFVAGFLGEPPMNFFDMEVRGKRLVGDNFTYPLSSELRESVSTTQHVTLGIRPEDISIVPAVSESYDFETTIDVVEPKGNENVVYLTFHENDGEQETLDAVVGGMQTLTPGQDAVARIPELALHLFRTDTGHALHNRSMEELEEPTARP